MTNKTVATVKNLQAQQNNKIYCDKMPKYVILKRDENNV